MGPPKPRTKGRSDPRIVAMEKREKMTEDLERLKEFYAETEDQIQSHHIKAHQTAFRDRKKLKRMIRKRETKMAKEDGTFVPKAPITIDDKRIKDQAIEYHKQNEEELLHAETNDEMRAYFSQQTNPKVALSVQMHRAKSMFIKSKRLVDDLLGIFGGVFFFVERGNVEEVPIREFMCRLHQEGYTSLFLIQETSRGPTHVMLVALPLGPTAFFRCYELDLRRDLVGAGKPLSCPPEVIMTNFKSRIGRRVGRLIEQQLSEEEELKARQVVTFHNQRDNIFFRAYRYIFNEIKDAETKTELEDKVKVRMQELGPRISFKLRWIQNGVYDPEYERYEFFENSTVESQHRTLFYL